MPHFAVTFLVLVTRVFLPLLINPGQTGLAGHLSSSHSVSWELVANTVAHTGISVPRRWGQAERPEVSLVYTGRPCLKQNKRGVQKLDLLDTCSGGLFQYIRLAEHWKLGLLGCMDSQGTNLSQLSVIAPRRGTL